MSLAAFAEKPSGLTPFALKGAPSFIERQFPVGRLSAEAFKERDAKQAQTLTAVGSYWKGRKPLILVRAVVLGCLLPATDDAATDLDTFLALMAMDDAAFGRRFDGSAAEFSRLFPELASRVATNRLRIWRLDVSLDELRKIAASFRPPLLLGGNPAEEAMLGALAEFAERPGSARPDADASEFARLFSVNADDLTQEVECRWRWRDDIDLEVRQERVAEAFATLPYAERIKHVRRPEECNEEELLAPIWPAVNQHLRSAAQSLADLAGC